MQERHELEFMLVCSTWQELATGDRRRAKATIQSKGRAEKGRIGGGVLTLGRRGVDRRRGGRSRPGEEVEEEEDPGVVVPACVLAPAPRVVVGLRRGYPMAMTAMNLSGW